MGGVNTQMLGIFVDDADAHCARARAAGAKIIDEPTTNDYGDDYWADRTYRVEDPEGHHWWFMQRVRDARPVAGDLDRTLAALADPTRRAIVERLRGETRSARARSRTRCR